MSFKVKDPALLTSGLPAIEVDKHLYTTERPAHWMPGSSLPFIIWPLVACRVYDRWRSRLQSHPRLKPLSVGRAFFL